MGYKGWMVRKAGPAFPETFWRSAEVRKLWKCHWQEPLGQGSRILPLGWLVTHTGRPREVKGGGRSEVGKPAGPE